MSQTGSLQRLTKHMQILRLDTGFIDRPNYWLKSSKSWVTVTILHIDFSKEILTRMTDSDATEIIISG